MLSQAQLKQAAIVSKPGGAKDEITIIIDGLQIRSTSTRILKTLDTAADSWTASIPWNPGDSPELDKRLLPFAYPRTEIYIGKENMISGYLYSVEVNKSVGGLVKNGIIFVLWDLLNSITSFFIHLAKTKR